METNHLYRQIFEDKVYFQQGIVLADGASVIDGGANIGLFTLFVAEHFPTSAIFAAEPAPETFRLLQANTRGRPRVRAFNCALGDRDAERSFRYFPNSTAGSGFYDDEALQKIQNFMRNAALKNEKLVRSFPGPEGRKRLFDILDEQMGNELVTVSVWSLDTLIANAGITQIDLLKLDVEGSECDVIRGISENHWAFIKQIVIEVHDSPKTLSTLLEMIDLHGLNSVCVDVEPFDLTRKTMLYAKRPGM